MAINLKFDSVGNPEPPTIILANRNGNKLGQLDVNVDSIDLSDKLVDASEFSFTINKYIDDKITNLWDKIVDFKLVYCKEWDMYFEINVELDEATETVKTVFCKQLGHAELSQIMLYNIEINTEDDIERDDYKISILYDENDPKASILNRTLEKAPHYHIVYVDPTITKIQRSFSFDGNSIQDAHQEIAEEIGCLFDYPSNLTEDGKINRGIYVYDMWQNCNDCGHRGEFTDKCPKCGSTNIKYGYGEDTTIFVTADELASSGIQLVTDTDSVKNCFKLEAGDDLMTATIRSCNPNGTDYMWYFSDNLKEDMSDELVKKLEDYDDLYSEYYSNHIYELDNNLLVQYNALVDKYKDYYNTDSTCLNCENKGEFYSECPNCGSDNLLLGKNLQSIGVPIHGYSSLMNAYYNTIDLDLYLESGLMPSIEMSETNAEEQAALLTSAALSPVAVADITIASLSTMNSAVLSMAKVIVKSTYKVQVNTSEIVEGVNSRSWRGNFVITNYSDEEDAAISEIISVEINDDNESFIKQKIDKTLNKEDTDDYSITGLFEKEYDDFCAELKKYALNPLTSFHDACQSCIDILIERGVGNGDTWSDAEDGSEGNLYEKLYTPYYNKLKAIESEMLVRENEINIIRGVYDTENNLVAEGLKTNIENVKYKIQDVLDFEKYLGTDLWFEFCSYRREDKYSNKNYVSDGLNNAELFKRAKEFYDTAENEIYKSAELQNSISTTLNNLLAIDKFKNLVKYFKNGNWIRVLINDKIYKLRLLEYGINFGDFNDISVEFADVVKIKNGITDVQGVLSQASSMATSYDYVQRQASQGNDAQNTVNEWKSDGINSAVVEIHNNDNKDVSFIKSGLLCRSYDDITGTYSPEQLKITHNTMAYTDDDWATVRQSIGKNQYFVYNKSNDVFEKKTGYGQNADFVTAGVVSGSEIIGGDIYSDNYSVANATGSYLNLRDGTFSFGGGSLRFEGGQLLISSPNVPTTGQITQINEEYLKTTSVYAQNLKVNSAKIEGQLTASQINTDGLIAENISGMTISGKYIEGGALFIGNVSGAYAEITSSGILNCNEANISGEITATGGNISGFTIGNSAIYNGTNSLTSTTSGVYLGIDGIRQYESDSAYVNISNGILKANGVDITGNINAVTISTSNISCYNQESNSEPLFHVSSASLYGRIGGWLFYSGGFTNTYNDSEYGEVTVTIKPEGVTVKDNNDLLDVTKTWAQILK